MRKLMAVAFDNNLFDFWSDIATPNEDIKPLYNLKVNIPLNNAEHQELLKSMNEKGIHTKANAFVDASREKK